MNRCSTATVLTDDDFDWPKTGGTTYTIDRVYLYGSLYLGFSGVTSSAAKTALTGLTLTVGSGATARTFAIADAGASGGTGSALTWTNHGLSWSNGDTVALKLTAAAAARPAKPTGLAATAGDATVDLSWTDPGDSSITRYQYRQRAGAAAWGAWTDIASSAPGGANATSYTVTGLMNGTAYRFRIRAVNGAGNGAQSAVAAATPAGAATTAPGGGIWSATLTVDRSSSLFGCSALDGHDRCSSALTDDDFVHGGATYRVRRLAWLRSANALQLELATAGGVVSGSALKTALGSLTLNADGAAFAVSASGAGPTIVSWPYDPATDWTDGQTVSVSLAAAPAARPAKPTGLAATAGDAQVTLSWTDPGDSSITGYQYRQKAGGAAWGRWTDIASSAPGGANAASYTVTGLANCTAHLFRVRAVNAAGRSPASDEAGPATPQAAPAAPPSGSGKLVGNVASGAACGYPVTFKRDVAQQFITGRHPGGYTLTHLDLAMENGAANEPGYAVTVHAPLSSDRNFARSTLPGKALGTLTTTASLPQGGEGFVRFAAPAGGIDLEPGRPYVLVIDVGEGASRRAKVSTAARGAEDGDGVAHWIIQGISRTRKAGSTGRWSNVPSLRLRMAVYGTAKPAPPPDPALVPEGAVWSASLTVQGYLNLFGGALGCGLSTGARCSVGLSSNEFTHDGVRYRFDAIQRDGNRDTLQLSIVNSAADPEEVLEAGAALAASGSLTLHVDGRAFPFADARLQYGRLHWDDAGLGWRTWQRVSLALTDAGAPSGAPPAAAPALEWARVTGAELALRFDAALDEASVPAASAFSVSVAGAARAVSSVTVSGETVTLTLAEAAASGETVTAGYAPPAQGPGLRLSGGGAAVAAFTGRAVTNDTPPGSRQERGPPGTAEPLTARVAQAPPEHRGTGGFEVRVAFSAPVAGRAKDAGATVRVAGGTLARAARVSGRKDLWALTVSPSGHGAVTVTLPATADCAAAGAVCTADGRRLETALTHTVPGPVTVSVADARAKEGEDATMDFAVTLSRAASGKVTVTYATRDGTARKGKDYAKAKGTLAFAAGETAKTVSVAILDDAVDEGEETFTLVLKKATGAVIADGEATGTIENDDPVPGAWLARFGRTVADQAVAAVRDRLGADRRPGFRGRIAGEALPDGTGTETAAGGGTGDGPLAVPELAEDERRAFMALLALKTGEGLEPDAGESRAVTGEEALAGTAFEFVREAGDGLSLGLWGRVARSGFSGRAGELSLDGDVATALLGTDWRRRDALFGLMLFRSRGEGGWRAPEGSGTVEASLSGLVPWAGLRRDGSPALWAAAGTGRGELTLAPEGRDPATAGLRWSMAAAGAAGAPATVDALGGARVGWRADAMAARTTSEAAAGLAASGTGTTRLRLGLEAAWAGTLSPRLEIGLRHDGGDAETGFGLEAGGGVRFEDPARGLSASLDGRALALHEDGDLEDWGVSVTLEWDPRPETRLGPSVVATRGWGGAASGGVDALLGPETVPGLAAADGGAWSLEAAYGLRRGNGMAGVPHLRMGGTEGLEELRLGYRIAPDADRAADASAEIWAEPGVGGTGPRAGAGLEWRW